MILGRETLPKIGWHGEEPLDRARFKPVGPVPLDTVAYYTKPTGGLWCSPVVRAGRHAQIVGTEWTAREDELGGIPFTLVRPHRGTRVVVIDSRADQAKEITTMLAPILNGPPTR